ncbi:MAG: putative signal transducing protein [Candidatus Dormibacteria bacterium]
MSENEFVELIDCGSALEGETIHAALEAAGLESYLRYDAFGSQIYPTNSGISGPVVVFVRETDLAAARGALGLDAPPADPDAWLADEPWRDTPPPEGDEDLG